MFNSVEFSSKSFAFLAFVFMPVFFGIVNAKAIDLKTSNRQTSVASEFSRDEFGRLLKKAAELCNANRFDECIAFSKKASRLKPDDFRPYYIAGIAYRAQRKLTTASENFAKAISRDPKNVKLFMEKGWTDYIRNAREDAVASYRGALRLDPKQGQAHLQIGNILRFDVATQNEAIAAYEAAIALKNPTLNAYDELGRLYVIQKNYSKAEEVFKKGISLDPNKMTGRFSLGRMLVKLGRIKEARQLWEGRTSDEDRVIPSFLTILERSEKLDLAKTKAEQKPNDPQANFDLGLTIMDGNSWMIDGRQKRALIYLKKALELKPDFVEAQYAIVIAHIQMMGFEKESALELPKEIAKLRRMNSELAKKAEIYRKSYKGGITGSPSNIENN